MVEIPRAEAMLASSTSSSDFSIIRCSWMGETRFDSFRRCALPITALRVTLPSSLAISAAVLPSHHSFFRRVTRSSVQLM